jgi:hypothetical protein
MRVTRLVVFVCFWFATAFFPNSAMADHVRGPWQIEVVDSSHGKGAGAFSSLAIDRFGNFHIAYSDLGGTALRYAFRAKGDKRWDKTTVDPMGGGFETLAVDSRGWAHIAYNSPKIAGLHYAEWNGKQWQMFLIDAVKTNHQTSIQLDSQGYPRISYYREQYSDRRTARCLKYAYFDGKTWFVQTVDHRSGTGAWNSLALDLEDRPHISYSIATGFLGFAYLDQSNWEHAMADVQDRKGKKSLHEVDSDSSLAMGSDGEPRIAYINATERSIGYAWREGDVWHQETIGSLVSTGADADRIALKLDRSGRPHVVFYDSGLGTLKYATRDKEQWRIETIDAGNSGQYASLYLDENDQPYVSYYAAAGRELRIAHRESLDSVQKQ